MSTMFQCAALIQCQQCVYLILTSDVKFLMTDANYAVNFRKPFAVTRHPLTVNHISSATLLETSPSPSLLLIALYSEITT